MAAQALGNPKVTDPEQGFIELGEIQPPISGEGAGLLLPCYVQ